jgi:hypothetical protein
MYFIGLDGVSVHLPARFRNANFARASFDWAIPAVLFLVPLLFVPLAYKWFFGAVFVVTAALSVYYFAARQRVDLVISEDGLKLGGIRRSRQIDWDDIARFVIRSPQRRTPLMLAFAPWRDQAQVVLLDGTTVRLRAIEPWHGFTAMTYLGVQRVTNADRTVESLNAVLTRRRSANR